MLNLRFARVRREILAARLEKGSLRRKWRCAKVPRSPTHSQRRAEGDHSSRSEDGERHGHQTCSSNRTRAMSKHCSTSSTWLFKNSSRGVHCI